MPKSKQLIGQRQQKRQERLAQPPLFRFAVCIPTLGPVQSEFMYSYGALMATAGASFVADGVADLATFMVKSTYLDSARQELAEVAIKWGASHILWLDSDMRFPRNAMVRLFNSRVPFVGTNYSTRRYPIVPTALKRVAQSFEEGGEACVTSALSTGLETVEAVGMGCALTHTDVFRMLGDPPWFRRTWDDARGWIGEDVYFCERVRAAGIEIVVDHDLSKELSHVGEFEYKLEHAEAWREMDDAESGAKLEVVG